MEGGQKVSLPLLGGTSSSGSSVVLGPPKQPLPPWSQMLLRWFWLPVLLISYFVAPVLES